jgi:hypothetical protein
VRNGNVINRLGVTWRGHCLPPKYAIFLPSLSQSLTRTASQPVQQTGQSSRCERPRQPITHRFNPRMLWGHCCSCTLRGSSTIMLKHASPGMKACSKLSQRRIPSPNTPYSRCLLPLPKVKPMSFNFLNTDRENFGTSLWLMSRQRGLTCSPRSLAPRKAHLEHLYDLGFVLLGVGLVNGSLHQSP